MITTTARDNVVLTLTHRSLHIPHDEAVLVVQELHSDLCDLQGNIAISKACDDESTSARRFSSGCQLGEHLLAF
jgi:hypothetical protein